MADRKVSRARKGAPSSSSHRAPRKSHGSELPLPAERMQAILQGYREYAWATSQNPLVARKTPQQTLKECIRLVRWLHWVTFGNQPTEGGGSDTIYAMLGNALQDLETQLEPLFDCASQVAEETGAHKRRVVLGLESHS